jgi:hypothetical protein
VQANTATDYQAVGIDASWLLINGLDAGCMRRFRDYISLSDWVTKLGLEQSIARNIGLSGKDFIALGWDYQSLMKVCGAMASQPRIHSSPDAHFDPYAASSRAWTTQHGS